jgi:predicted hotdog family 3-hydroxylacyl-ACP dehydratase
MQLTTEVNSYSLDDLMPHRPPMRWIDSITTWGEQGAGRALAILDSAKSYYQNGQLCQTMFIELMAQAFGYLKAHDLIKNHQRIKRTYLAGVQTYQFHQNTLPAPGSHLIINVEPIHLVAPFIYIKGQIEHKDQLLCSAEFRCYAEIFE